MSTNATLGRGLVVEHKGRAYRLAPVDHMKVVGDFEDHLRAAVLKEVDGVRRNLGSVAGELAMKGFLELAASGSFDFGSLYWLDCLKFARHQKALVLFCLRAEDATVTRALAEEIYAAGYPEVDRLLYGDPEPAPGGEADPGNPAAPGSAT